MQLDTNTNVFDPKPELCMDDKIRHLTSNTTQTSTVHVGLVSCIKCLNSKCLKIIVYISKVTKNNVFHPVTYSTC